VSTERTPAERLGSVLGGRYRLERLLGAGGMGAVYEAVDPQGGRFAVKLLLGMSEGRRETARFAREARITSTLSHPNITNVLDSGVDAASGAPYLVMELLSGQDLDARLRSGGPLAPSVAVRILLRACAGIEAAHVAGIIHRDLKPSNIFLHDAGGGEVVVKVCDFGLAKQLFTEDSVTQSGTILGSPSYMSPEQLRNTKGIDGRTDVWSLGMTLYEMLAGAPAFDHAQSLTALMILLTTQDVPPIQDRSPWVSEALAMVTHGALLRDLDARCPNVGALIDALRPLSGGSERLVLSMFGLPALERERAVAPRARLPRAWASVEAHAPSLPPPSHRDSATVRLLGHTLGGRYPLLGVLGHGGMGAVYETRGSAGEPLAIKVIRGDGAEDGGRRKSGALERFVREARAVMSITSEHVVKVVDADTDPAQHVPFIVMERLVGQDLAELLRTVGPLEPAPLARIFTEACRGLAAAHALGVVHRDIKPANLFLHELPSGVIVTKICDFGVAKRVLAGDADETAIDLTSTGGFLGSPLYFSPEQAQNAKNVDLRSDIWSLAISMYEAISGRRPWEGATTVGEIILAVCTEDVPPLLSAAPWIPAELAAVIHRGLRRNAAERYASMEEFAAALEPFATEPRVRRAMLVPVPRDKRALATTMQATVSVRGALPPPARSAREPTGLPASAVSVREPSSAHAAPASVSESLPAHTSAARELRSEPAKRRSAKVLVAGGVLAVLVVAGAGGGLQLLRARHVGAANVEAAPPQPSGGAEVALSSARTAAASLAPSAASLAPSAAASLAPSAAASLAPSAAITPTAAITPSASNVTAAPPGSSSAAPSGSGLGASRGRRPSHTAASGAPMPVAPVATESPNAFSNSRKDDK
jgi:serine/threonine protein kinase